MKLRLFNFLGILILAGCVQKTPATKTSRIFPDGIYNQSVRLEIKLKENMSFPFTTLSRVENRSFQIMGFDPFGGKAFEASGHLDRPDDIKLNLFIKLPISINKKFIRTTILTIQDIQKIKASDLSSESGFEQYKGKDFNLNIYKYFEGIPSSMIVDTAKWKAYIQLNNYKPLSAR